MSSPDRASRRFVISGFCFFQVTLKKNLPDQIEPPADLEFLFIRRRCMFFSSPGEHTQQHKHRFNISRCVFLLTAVLATWSPPMFHFFFMSRRKMSSPDRASRRFVISGFIFSCDFGGSADSPTYLCIFYALKTISGTRSSLTPTFAVVFRCFRCRRHALSVEP